MQLRYFFINFCIGMFFSTVIVAASMKRATTDEDYKIIWQPENLTACIWTHENNKKTRELGISDEMWKHMMQTCLAGVKEGRETAKNNNYDDVTIQEVSTLRYDNNAISRYKSIFPDWKARETRVIESIRKDCGAPCNNIEQKSE